MASSTFNSFPEPVMELVIHYLGNQHVNCKPLLYTNRIWRYAVISQLSRAYELAYDYSNGTFTGLRSSLLEQQHVHPSIFGGFVKHVMTSIIHRDICDTDVAKVHARMAALNTTLPSARMLHLNINDSDNIYRHNSGIMLENAKALFAYLHKIIPNVTIVRFSYNTSAQNTRAFWSNIGNCLMEEFSPKARLNSVECCSILLPFVPPSNYITDLTDLTYTFRNNSQAGFELFKRCAPHLLCLNVTYINDNLLSVYRLVQDTDGHAIVYPMLKCLEIHFPTFTNDTDTNYTTDTNYSDGNDYVPSVASDAMPFPFIEYLCITGYYMFYDDIIFRGNQETLKEIKIPLYESLINIMFNSAAGRSSTAPNYKYVTVSTPVENRYNDEWMEIELLLDQIPQFFDFLAWLTQSARSLKIEHWEFSGWLDPTLFNEHSFDGLQFLRFVHDFSLANIIEIIYELPSLVAIETQFIAIGDVYMRASMDDIINRLTRRYKVLSENFQLWRVNICEANPWFALRCLPKCVLALAAICPQFTKMSLDSRYNSAYKWEMGTVLNELQNRDNQNIKLFYDMYADNNI